MVVFSGNSKSHVYEKHEARALKLDPVPGSAALEEAAASLSAFALAFGAGSRLCFCLKQIKTNRIWWIWKRGKKPLLNKQEIYDCCLPMKTQWRESSACNVDGCRLENKA